MIARFLANRDAASSMEYAMVAALISIVVIAAATQIGTRINGKFYGPLLSAFQ